jgi:hypothetical protein
MIEERGILVFKISENSLREKLAER